MRRAPPLSAAHTPPDRRLPPIDPRRPPLRMVEQGRAAAAVPDGSGLVNRERLLASLLAILAPLGVVIAIIARYPNEMHALWQRLLTP